MEICNHNLLQLVKAVKVYIFYLSKCKNIKLLKTGSVLKEKWVRLVYYRGLRL